MSDAASDAETKRRKLSGAVGRLVGDCIAPGVGAILNVAKDYVELARALRDEREAQRLKRFHDWIIHTDDSDDPDPAQVNAISVEDFKAVLSALLDDIESEKAQLYAQLVRAQAARRIEAGFFRPIALALRTIAAHQISAMRRAFIADVGPVLRVSGRAPKRGMAEPPATSPHYPSYQELVSQGLVKEEKLTHFGRQFVAAVYSPNDLTPESIGEVRQIGSCAFVADVFDGWSDTLALAVSENIVSRGVAPLPVINVAGHLARGPDAVSRVRLAIRQSLVLVIHASESDSVSAISQQFLEEILQGHRALHVYAGGRGGKPGTNADAIRVVESLKRMPAQDAVQIVSDMVVGEIAARNMARLTVKKQR